MFPFITALYLCPGTPWPWHVKKVLKRVAVEQIISQLPARTMEWVQRHQPDSLTKAIQLEQDQMSPGTQQASETPPTPVMQCKRLLVPGFCSPAFKVGLSSTNTFRGARHRFWKQKRHARITHTVRVRCSGSPYRVPVSTQGGIHQALVDSGSVLSLIQQRLI